MESDPYKASDGGPRYRHPFGFTDPGHPIENESSGDFAQRLRGLPPGAARVEALRGYERFGGVTAQLMAQRNNNTLPIQDRSTLPFQDIVNEPFVAPYAPPAHLQPVHPLAYMPGQALATLPNPMAYLPPMPTYQQPAGYQIGAVMTGYPPAGYQQPAPLQPARRQVLQQTAMTGSRLSATPESTIEHRGRPLTSSQYVNPSRNSSRRSSHLTAGAATFTPRAGARTPVIVSSSTPRGGASIDPPRPRPIAPTAGVSAGLAIHKTSSGRSVPANNPGSRFGPIAQPMRGRALATTYNSSKYRSSSMGAQLKNVKPLAVGTKVKTAILPPRSKPLRTSSLGGMPRSTRPLNPLTSTGFSPRPAGGSSSGGVRVGSSPLAIRGGVGGTTGSRGLSTVSRGLSTATRGLPSSTATRGVSTATRGVSTGIRGTSMGIRGTAPRGGGNGSRGGSSRASYAAAAKIPKRKK